MFGNRIPMIDSHFHIRGDGDLETLLSVSTEIQAALGLDGVCVAAIPAWDAASVGQNVLCALYKALHPRCYAYAGLDHDTPNADVGPDGFLRQAQRFVRMGFDGFKSIEAKPTARRALGVGLDDARYADFWAYLAQRRAPVLWHVADPEENWRRATCDPFAIASGWCYEDEGFASKETLYGETERVLARNPKLNVVFAHLYFLGADQPRVRAFLDAHPHARIDVTPGSEMYGHFDRDRDAWRDFFNRYADRVLFGTDNGWGDDTSPAQKVVDGCQKILLLDAFFSTDAPVTLWRGTPQRGLALPEPTLRRMYRDNFLAMHGGAGPRALDVPLAAAYAREVWQGVQTMPQIPAAKKEQLRQATRMLETLAQKI
ncbi:MAG: amidohydrolase [Oscillospiraceae bacterium]|jgi:hypothetical protein|nr:amidohydrolase [Oscillospiraceae bacterium]